MRGRFALSDVFVILLLLLFAGGVQFFRIHNAHPQVSLSSDAANIAGIAAAYDHPDMFRGDAILGDKTNFRFYMTVHVPLIRAFERITGYYASWFAWFLGLHVLLQALGFYLLGRILYESRYWAFLLAFAVFGYVSTGVDFWGIYIDPIPRVTFQSLLPFLLAAAVASRAVPALWPPIMALMGAMVYIHPVSAPSWGFALWLGFWCFIPRQWPWTKRLTHMALCGIAFVIAIIPFAWNYLSTRAPGPSGASDARIALDVLRSQFPVYYFSVCLLAKKLLSILLCTLLLPVGVIAAAVVFRLRRGDARNNLAVCVWIVGILFVSLGIPFVDQHMAYSRGGMPAQLDIVRGIRYLVPLLIIFALWMPAEIQKRYPKHSALICILGGAFVFFWLLAHPPSQAASIIQRIFVKAHIPTGRIYKAETAETTGYSRESAAAEKGDYIKMLNALRTLTPLGARILPDEASRPLAVRYYAMRPVVFCKKDVGAYSIGNRHQLVEWSLDERRFNAAQNIKNLNNRLAVFLSLARNMKADFVVMKTESGKPRVDGGKIIFANASFLVVSVAK